MPEAPTTRSEAQAFLAVLGKMTAPALLALDRAATLEVTHAPAGEAEAAHPPPYRPPPATIRACIELLELALRQRDGGDLDGARLQEEDVLRGLRLIEAQAQIPRPGRRRRPARHNRD